MNISYIVFLLAYFFATKCLAYDCKTMNITKARDANLQQNNIVFVGKMLNSSEDKLTFKVIQVFKGEVDSILNIYNDAPFFKPNTNDISIIYAFQHKRDSIRISECSLSRTFENPERILVYDIPYKNHDANQARDLDMEIQIIKLKAKIDLNEEIMMLQMNSVKHNYTTCKSYALCLVATLSVLILFTCFSRQLRNLF